MVVELDVRHDRDLRAQPLDRPVGLVALGDEPALPRAGVAAELGDLAADEPRRIEPELGEDERDHPGRRRLSVRAGDDDRAPERDELGEEVRPRRARRPTGTRSTRSPPSRPARPARARARPRRPRARCRYGVSTRSQPPTSAPQARARKAYEERPGTADPDEPEPPTAERRKRDQLLRDLVGGLWPRHRQHRRAHRLEPRPVGKQLVDQRRHAVGARAPGRRRRRRRARSGARSASGGRRSRADTGRGSQASPPPRAPRPCHRRARSRCRAQRARHRTRSSRRGARSRPGAPGRAALS